jgi:hypothetical protein
LPGTAPRFTDWENFQDPGFDYAHGKLSRNLWNFGDQPAPNQAQGFHITGYVFAFSGSKSRLNAAVQNQTLQPEGSGTNRVPNTERVLIADATVSWIPNNPGTMCTDAGRFSVFGNSYDYVDVTGWFYKPHLSPHLKGTSPAGGNLGFKDGHVGWLRFPEMRQRATSGISFWF